MSDLEDPANKLLTDQGPLSADGPSTADTTVPRSRAHVDGIPDALPPQWCANCQADVVPRGRGQCPKCGRVLQQSFLARRRPVNRLRVDQIHNELAAEYRPATSIARATCRHLAMVYEQLEVTRPGSPEHQRLIQLSQSLGQELEQLARGARTPKDFSGMSTAELIARIEDLYVKATALQEREQQRPRAEPEPKETPFEIFRRAALAESSGPVAAPLPAMGRAAARSPIRVSQVPPTWPR